MSRKYIGKRNNPNFVYPNYNLNEYETEIVHNINDNIVYGTVSNFTGTSVSSTGITFSFDYTWVLNGAEPYIMEDGNYSFLSVHAMDSSSNYFRPWRLVARVSGTAATTKSGSLSFTVTPSQLGVDSFTNGNFQFDIRMISKRVVYPVSVTFAVSGLVPPTPTPSPTPTVTPTHATPTPTPSTTPSVITYYSGATLNVTDPGWIKYDTNVANDVYEFISSTGTHTITACTNCNTIIPGFPFADVASFTITNCGNACGGVTPVTPTPTPTNTTKYYYRLTRCDNFQTYWSQQYPSGTFSSGDRVQGGTGVFYVVSGSQTSNPGGTLYTVTATGLSGCP